jgi:hypothetical protein
MVYDSFWMAGVVMYWAEGTKAKPRLELTNSDERALRLFIAWTQRYHSPYAEFVLELHLHEGNDDKRARSHWAATLGLRDPRSIRLSSSDRDPSQEEQSDRRCLSRFNDEEHRCVL